MNSDDATLPSPAPQLRIHNKSSDKRHVFARWYRSLEDAANIQCAILFYTDQSLVLAIARWNMINNYTAADTLNSLRVPLSLVINTIFLLWHLFSASPEPINTELRDYLSGSTVVDLVGEFPPPKLRLLCLDLLFFAIQFMMLIVSHEQKKLDTKTKAPPAETQTQDIDAEEQGIQRSEQTAPDAVVEIAEEDGESAALLESEVEEEECIPLLSINITDSIKGIME